MVLLINTQIPCNIEFFVVLLSESRQAIMSATIQSVQVIKMDSGVVDNAPNKSKIILNAHNQMKGIPKSGRPWKDNKER